MTPENRSNEDAAQLIAAHDENPPQGPWDECDGCHVEYVRSLLARVAAVEQAVRDARTIAPCPITSPHSPHGHSPTTAFPGGVVLCRGVAALAASPTPTGPEPATECEHGETGAHSFYVAEGRDWDHSAEYATCPGPATQEPTEETVSDLVPREDIERIVGATRHELKHYARAVSSEKTVYILHSRKCLDSGIDLRDCEFSVALDRGIDLGHWREDVALVVEVLLGNLHPIGFAGLGGAAPTGTSPNGVGDAPKETRE